MITRLRIHNFKTLLNFEVKLARRHLLIGKNNSGKSNLCHALRFLGATAASEYETIRLPGGQDSACHWYSTSRTIELACTAELPIDGQRTLFDYELQLGVEQTATPSGTPQSPFRTLREMLTVRSKGSASQVLVESDGTTVSIADNREQEKDSKRRGRLTKTDAPRNASMLCKLYEPSADRRTVLFKRFLGSTAYYTLSPPLMKFGWSDERLAGTVGTRVLTSEGTNLAIVLFQIKNEDEPAYRAILSGLSRIAPELDSLGYYVTPDNKPVPYVILKGGRRAGWEILSDGTLLCLAMLTVFYHAQRVESATGWPTLSIVEEPENGVYVGAFRSIWEHVESVAPLSQFVLTSHNPYFIDLFDRDLSSVTRLKREGEVTTAKPLSDFKGIVAQHRDDFSLGELHFKEVFERD